jgi:hypothetical protein
VKEYNRKNLVLKFDSSELSQRMAKYLQVSFPVTAQTVRYIPKPGSHNWLSLKACGRK